MSYESQTSLSLQNLLLVHKRIPTFMCVTCKCHCLLSWADGFEAVLFRVICAAKTQALSAQLLIYLCKDAQILLLIRGELCLVRKKAFLRKKFYVSVQALSKVHPSLCLFYVPSSCSVLFTLCAKWRQKRTIHSSSARAPAFGGLP